MFKSVIGLMNHYPYTFSTDFSSGLDPRFINPGTWSVVGGVLVNVPGLGDNLVVNGGFSTDTANWNSYSSGSLASVAGGQVGNCLQITNGGSSNGGASQVINVANNVWLSLNLYQTNITDYGVIGAFGSLPIQSIGINGWANYKYTLRTTSVNPTFIIRNGGSALGNVSQWDEIVLNPLTLNTLFLPVKMASPKVLASVAFTRTARLCGGLVICDDGNGNFIQLWENGSGTLYLDKVTNWTTITPVINHAITYSAGKEAYVDYSAAPAVAIGYNGTQLATGTISDEIYMQNRRVAPFSTDVGVQISKFSVVCS